MFDVGGAIVILFLTLPVFIVASVLIKLTSKGPVFFRHRRLGLGGKPFWCLKFRTMVDDAEKLLRENAELYKKFQEHFKLRDDPRLTPVGRFLRKTSVDELPQLINVLRGEMSLVGPRPIVSEEVYKYDGYHEKLFSVKPGVTGLWQATARHRTTTYMERVLLDMEYIDNRSLKLDLTILLLTVPAVLLGSGAH